MATQSIQGLFGGMGSPEEMQRQLVEQKAAQFAEMNQNQQLSSMAYKGGANLGQGLAGAFGVDIQDPTIQRATRLRQLASQYNTNTAQGLREMAAALQTIDPESAFQLTQRAMAMDKAALDTRKGEAEISLKEAEILAKNEEKKTPEQKNAYDIVSNDPLVVAGSPQFKKNYVETLKGLTSKAITAQVDKVGVAEKSREPVYFDKTTNEQFTVKDGKRVSFSGGIDQLTAKTNVSVDAKGQEAFTVELAKDDAKEVKNARGLRDAAIGELGSLQKMQQLNQQQLMSGSFATGRVGALNLLNTLGMTSGQDTTKLANSEQYTKITGDLLLDKIKKLGTQPSSTDREFIAKILPQLENSPAARQELVNYLVNKANKVVSETTRLDTYARKNKGLEGFVPEVPLVGQTVNVSSMSTEELLKIAKGQK